MEDEEDQCKNLWLINCCWVGKGLFKTVGVEVFFKNLLTSSWWGHSLVKWSPPRIRQGNFSYLLFLDTPSVFCVLLYSCWVVELLNLFLPFLFVPEDSEDWTPFTLVETTGTEAVLELGKVWLAWEACWFCFFVDLAIDYVWTEPSVPLTGGFIEGLEGFDVGWGGFKIKSYRVLD